MFKQRLLYAAMLLLSLPFSFFWYDFAQDSEFRVGGVRVIAYAFLAFAIVCIVTAAFLIFGGRFCARLLKRLELDKEPAITVKNGRRRLPFLSTLLVFSVIAHLTFWWGTVPVYGYRHRLNGISWFVGILICGMIPLFLIPFLNRRILWASWTVFVSFGLLVFLIPVVVPALADDPNASVRYIGGPMRLPENLWIYWSCAALVFGLAAKNVFVDAPSGAKRKKRRERDARDRILNEKFDESTVLDGEEKVMANDTGSPVPDRRTKSCPYCSEQILITASKCKHCGEWLQQRRTVAAGMVTSHAPVRTVPASTAVILTVVTLGIYQVFWLWRVFTDLHARGSTETSPGKAVGFLFIPFYNFVWVFLVWNEFAAAVKREYCSAGAAPPSTGVTVLAPIGAIVGFVFNMAAFPAGSVIAVILLPISIGNGQIWLNELSTLPTGQPGGTSGVIVATKSCPTCGEQVPIEARLCRFCQHAFSESEVAQMTLQRNQAAEKFAREQHRQKLESREKVCRIWGWVLIALAGLFFISSVAGLISGPDRNADWAEHIIGFTGAIVILCGLPGGFGFSLLRKATTARIELQHLQ